MSDTALHRAVMEALAENPHVHADEIVVETLDDRGDITLRGTVGSIVQQAEAMRTAARVPGVRHVEDGLGVRLMGIDGRADADTEAAVLDALGADDAIHAGDIDVEVKDGAVTLSGLVEVVSQRDRAERIARGVPGAASVDNRLRVWLTVSADDVAERMTDAIGRDALLGRDSITVRVTGNDVALSGAVTSLAHRDAAIAAAEAAPGVARVHDEITIGDVRASSTSARPEFPTPIQPPGERRAPASPARIHQRAGFPDVVDEDMDRYGVEATAARLAGRLARVAPHAARVADDGAILLTPPLAPAHDRIAGPASGRATLVVFGAHGTRSSRSLGALLDAVRQRHPATIGVAWRHYPDPVAHPRAVVLALAVEAAAEAGRFWTLTRELLRLRHHDPGDVHGAIVRSSLDPDRTLEAMRSGAGEDRIADDVASALASGVTAAPALFIAGERYRGELRAAPVLAAIERA